MHFGPKEIGDFLHLLKANEKPSPEEGPDWETILATEVLFQQKVLRVLRSPAVGPGSLREKTSPRAYENSDLLRPGERAARAQDSLKLPSCKVEGPRGVSEHRFTMLAPKGDLANITCQESIIHADYEFTRLWERIRIETQCDFPSATWLHTLGRMTQAADVRSGVPERTFLLNHASGWVKTPQGEPEEAESWMETFDAHENLARIVQEGETDLVFTTRDGKTEMKRGKHLEATQRSRGANHTSIILPGSNKVLTVSIDPFGLIDELQNLADDGGSELKVRV